MPAGEFRDYYSKVLGLGHDDFEQLICSLNTGLPSVFRVTGTPELPLILEKLTKYKFIKPVAFLEHVYCFKLKDEDPLYREFIEFLVSQTDLGNIQRQEVVSMLPHYFLDLRPDLKVLETCASPGSKTKQLLEVIGTDGVLISNDRSPSRANILIGEASKKASPCFIVTRLDAAEFPTMETKFDRICCDVPCSSDGTIRKNASIMDRWSISMGMGLRLLQQRILLRSLGNLAPDGLLVYSTCSLNPIENENVIAKALETGKCVLVDAMALAREKNLPIAAMRVRPGITKFVHDKISFNNEELSKCIRIFPHDQDTGGFFIAVLRRAVDKQLVKPQEPVPDAPEQPVVHPDPYMLGRQLHMVPEIVMSKINSCFRPGLLREFKFVSLTDSFNTIFCVSRVAAEFIASNPCLKIQYAGLKAFSLSELDGLFYRPKTDFLELISASPDHTATLDEFKMLIRDKYVGISSLSFSPSGYFVLGVQSLRFIFCGFAGGDRAFLYINESHRKAFQSLFI